MTARRHTIAALAERLTRLSEGYRDDVAMVVEEARQAQVDPAALRRLVAWMRLDAVQRAEREAAARRASRITLLSIRYLPLIQAACPQTNYCSLTK